MRKSGIAINRVKLYDLILQNNLTYGELAKKAGLNAATISFIKNGKTCSLSTANAIAEALGVTAEEILLKR